jgi:hypothetical protein
MENSLWGGTGMNCKKLARPILMRQMVTLSAPTYKMDTGIVAHVPSPQVREYIHEYCKMWICNITLEKALGRPFRELA